MFRKGASSVHPRRGVTLPKSEQIVIFRPHKETPPLLIPAPSRPSPPSRSVHADQIRPPFVRPHKEKVENFLSSPPPPQRVLRPPHGPLRCAAAPALRGEQAARLGAHAVQGAPRPTAISDRSWPAPCSALAWAASHARLGGGEHAGVSRASDCLLLPAPCAYRYPRAASPPDPSL